MYGVGTLFDFAAAMLVGIISGTYSTWFVAAPMTIWFEDLAARRRRARPRPRLPRACGASRAEAGRRPQLRRHRGPRRRRGGGASAVEPRAIIVGDVAMEQRGERASSTVSVARPQSVEDHRGRDERRRDVVLHRDDRDEDRGGRTGLQDPGGALELAQPERAAIAAATSGAATRRKPVTANTSAVTRRRRASAS